MSSLIPVFFHCEESYSLFSGEFSRGRFGGAGLQMYFLACEIAKDPEFKVHWVFREHPIEGLSHRGIEFRAPIAPIKRGVPIWSRHINAQRKAALYACKGTPVLISTMAHKAPELVEWTQEAKGISIYRCASDADVTRPFLPTKEKRDRALQAISQCEFIIVQNEFQQETLRNITDKSSAIITNGMPSVETQESPRDIILWVSSSLDVKQPWYFLDLARALPRESFVMVIPCQQKVIWDFVCRAAAELPNVELISEQISYEKVNQLFARAKLFVNTSLVEGFPNTFLQALAAGTPIISLLVNPRELLSDKRFGYCANGNIVDFVSTTAKMLKNEASLADKGTTGRQFAIENFDIKKAAEKYKDVIRKCLSQ